MRTALLASLLVLALSASPGAQAPQTTAFVASTILDGTGRTPIYDGVILVRDGKVVAIGPTSTVVIPPGAARVDFTNKTILPGFINSHGHVGGETSTREDIERELLLYARYGVTSVFSLGGDGPNSFRVRDAAAPRHARLFVAGAVVGGNTADAATAEVARNADLKANWIKVRVDDGLGSAQKMAKEGWKAAIEEAHARKLPVAAHIFYLNDAKDLLREGVDLIAHSVRDDAVDAEIVNLLLGSDVCVVPTLMREVSTFVYESTPEFFSDPFFLRYADKAAVAQFSTPQRQEEVKQSASAQRYKVALEQASLNLGRLSRLGVRIAMGTDTGPAGRFQGYFEHLELEMMAKAGLRPRQIILSATGDAAHCMKQARVVGTLAPGAFADFVVYGQSPLDDIRNTRTLESVWIGGARLP